MLFICIYVGVLLNVKNQIVLYKLFCVVVDDIDVVVCLIVNNNGELVVLDYCLEKMVGGWKVYDINISGLWLLEMYKNQFVDVISKCGGVVGLVSFLNECNLQFEKGLVK